MKKNAVLDVRNQIHMALFSDRSIQRFVFVPTIFFLGFNSSKIKSFQPGMVLSAKDQKTDGSQPEESVALTFKIVTHPWSLPSICFLTYVLRVIRKILAHDFSLNVDMLDGHCHRLLNSFNSQGPTWTTNCIGRCSTYKNFTIDIKDVNRRLWSHSWHIHEVYDTPQVAAICQSTDALYGSGISTARVMVDAVDHEPAAS